jgi:hypothetical protein
VAPRTGLHAIQKRKISPLLELELRPFGRLARSTLYYFQSLSLSLGRFFSFLALYTVGRALGRGISPSEGLYLYTEQYKHRINAHNGDSHALSEIRTRDHSVRASEHSSYLRPRGHCDRRLHYMLLIINFISIYSTTCFEFTNTINSNNATKQFLEITDMYTGHAIVPESRRFDSRRGHWIFQLT